MAKPILTILIPTLINRQGLCKALVDELNSQIAAENYPCKVVTYPNDGRSELIGSIRNKMLSACKSKYCSFFDDDDKPGPNYVSRFFETLKLYPDIDAIGFIVDCYVSRIKDGNARIAHEYPDWCTPKQPAPFKYHRTINHLAFIKTDLAVQAGFDNMGHGEDYAYSVRLKPLISSSISINDTLYHYYFEPAKPAIEGIAHDVNNPYTGKRPPPVNSST